MLEKYIKSPLTRRAFCKCALLILLPGKAIGSGAVWLLPPDASWPALIASTAALLLFFWLPYICVACRRLDALGSEFMGNAGFLVLIPAGSWYMNAFDLEPFFSLTHYAVQAALLLSLALFPDKPVSGTGYVLENGRYVKPEKGNA